MTRIGIIICARYGDCGGGKCLRSMRERQGAFSIYPAKEPLELAGYSGCGGCPGGNVEHLPLEFKKNGVDVVHLATGLVVGYPPCPHIRDFKTYLETEHGLKVVVGTHPIPAKYRKAHGALPFWDREGMADIAGHLISESPSIQADYD